MLRPSKKTVILLVAGVVVCGLAAGLVLSGDSVSGSLGALGRTAIEKSVGLFAYSNKSTDAGKSFQKTKAALAKASGPIPAEESRVADASVAGGGVAGMPSSDAATVAVVGTGSGAEAVPGMGVPVEGGAADEPGPAAGPSAEATADPTEEAPIGVLSPDYVEATVPSNPVEENDVTIDPDSEEDWGNEEGDEFVFDDERTLRTEGPEYSALGKKDPFYAMVTAKEQKAASSELLDPDRLRLVGVIWAKQGIGALVEDGRGRGYCLHEGDRVLFGRVVTVTRDKCVIHQVIYGEFKTVELHLTTQREEE
jgi:hypothetical protein